jgi:hypothetical protein
MFALRHGKCAYIKSNKKILADGGTMLKRGLLLLILLLSVTGVRAQEGGQAGDQTDTTDSNLITGLITVDGAQVRIGPDFAYDAISELPLNASVTVLGRAGDFYSRWDGRQWIQIVYGNGTAWIYARLVRTSKPFNSIPPRGMMLPRNRDGRVPPEFDLSTELCSQWQGDFSLSGNFISGDSKLVATIPSLPGATVYSVIVIAPDGFRTAFDSQTNVVEIELDRLPFAAGTYTWRAVPYWANAIPRYTWQQICLLRTGGTFDKPDTKPKRGTG